MFSLHKMAYESLAMISSALSRLDCGQLGVIRSVTVLVVFGWVACHDLCGTDLGRVRNCCTVLTSPSLLLLVLTYSSIYPLPRPGLILLRYAFMHQCIHVPNYVIVAVYV